MNLIHRLGRSSLVYAGTNVLQKGALFLLLPLYTRFLSPTDYGVLAMVTAVNGLLAILFTLALQGAVTRFYFEYRDDPAVLRRFWGTAFTAILALSTGGVLLLLLVGERLLGPLLGGVPFWPFVALGILATLFQPFVTMFLNVLQTREQAGKYAAFSLAQFGFTTLFTIGLVVAGGMGALGALVALTGGAALFFVIALWALRAEFDWCFDTAHFRRAIAYALPQVPHSLAGQLTAVTDRVVLNALRGTAAAGIYSVGAMFGMIIELVCNSVNRAYMPIGMDVLRRQRPEEYPALARVGMAMATAFCLLGVIVAAFAHDLLVLFTAPAFHAAAPVVPFIAFAGVASGFYYIYVNALFFDERGVRLIPLGTATALLGSVSLNLLLIPRFGMLGAAVAGLVTQIITTVLIATLARRYEPVRWSYRRMLVAYAGSLVVALLVASPALTGPLGAAARLVGVFGAAIALGWWLMGDPRAVFHTLRDLMRGAPLVAI